MRWISNLGHAEYDSIHNYLRLIGTVQDITPRKQAELERQALLEIMQGLANTTDLQELLKLIHYSIAKVIYARNCFVVLYNEESELFEEIYSVDQYDPPAPPAKLEKSITSYVFHSGEPLLLKQADFDQLVVQDRIELVGTDSASWLGAPLKTSGKTIGVIAVQDYENPSRYSEHDKEVLVSIASQIALAINHRRAVEAVRESEQRYRALFEDMPVAVWEDDLSEIDKYLDSLKGQGIRDFHRYFETHPEDLVRCRKLVRILDVNKACLRTISGKEQGGINPKHPTGYG